MPAIKQSSPFGYTIFCDDLRQEQNGKVTLVGVYGPELIIHKPFPALLPKLAFSIFFVERAGDTEGDLRLRIYLPENEDGKPIFEQALPDEVSQQLRLPPVVNGEEDPLYVLNVQLEMSPVLLIKAGAIRVRMASGDQEYKLGALRVVSRSPESARPAETSPAQSLPISIADTESV